MQGFNCVFVAKKVYLTKRKQDLWKDHEVNMIICLL
jgi:hypothetical protein